VFWHNWREFPGRIAARDTRDWRERRDGQWFEVQGFRNFEPWTSNFRSRLWRNRETGGRFEHPAKRFGSL